MLRRFTKLLAASTLAALSVRAIAEPRAERSWPALTPYGGYLLVGGGLTGYRDGALRAYARTGGAWDLRLGLGSRKLLAGEVASLGTFARAGALGRYLGTTGGEAVVRLQLPLETADFLVEPFGVWGAGWARFEVRDARRAAARASGAMLVLPVGIGLTGGRGPFLLDVRTTCRWTFGDAPVRTARGARASLKGWTITSSLGWEL